MYSQRFPGCSLTHLLHVEQPVLDRLNGPLRFPTLLATPGAVEGLACDVALSPSDDTSDMVRNLTAVCLIVVNDVG